MTCNKLDFIQWNAFGPDSHPSQKLHPKTVVAHLDKQSYFLDKNFREKMQPRYHPEPEFRPQQALYGGAQQPMYGTVQPQQQQPMYGTVQPQVFVSSETQEEPKKCCGWMCCLLALGLVVIIGTIIGIVSGCRANNDWDHSPHPRHWSRHPTGGGGGGWSGWDGVPPAGGWGGWDGVPPAGGWGGWDPAGVPRECHSAGGVYWHVPRSCTRAVILGGGGAWIPKETKNVDAFGGGDLTCESRDTVVMGWGGGRRIGCSRG